MLALRFSVGRARGSDLGSWIQRGIDLGLKCPLDYEREVSRHSRRPPRCARAYGGESAHRLSDPQEAKTAAGGHSRCRKRLLRADGGLSVAARTSPRRPTRRCGRRLTRPRSLRDRGSVVPPEPDDALTPSQSVARLLAGIDALAGSEWSPADQIHYVRTSLEEAIDTLARAEDAQVDFLADCAMLASHNMQDARLHITDERLSKLEKPPSDATLGRFFVELGIILALELAVVATASYAVPALIAMAAAGATRHPARPTRANRTQLGDPRSHQPRHAPRGRHAARVSAPEPEEAPTPLPEPKLDEPAPF